MPDAAASARLAPGERPLRVLAIHRHFWPDTPPYASLLRAIGERWAADGHAVVVLSTQPGYKAGAPLPKQPAHGRLGALEVYRVDLPPERGRPLRRLANLLRFAAAILRRALRSGPWDLIMVSTAPPVVAGAGAALAARLTRARFVYHCMDVHPEAGRLAGDFRNPLLFRLLRRIDGWTCRQAATVVVLSPDMEAALRSRPGGASVRCTVLNNFDLPSFEQGAGEAERPAPPAAPGSLRILFAGNLGRFQHLPAMLDVMARLKGQAVELVFMGEGAALPELRRRAAADPGLAVRFLPHGSVAAARRAMRAADLCLVSLAPGVHRYAYPSKAVTALREGCPLLVAVEPESALAEWVRSRGCGVVVPPDDPEAAAATLRSLLDQPEQLRALRAAARRVGDEELDPDAILDRWSALLRTVAEAPA